MRVAIIAGAGVSASFLRIFSESSGFEAVFPDHAPLKISIERLASELDLYPMQPSKQKAQWKSETRVRRLK